MSKYRVGQSGRTIVICEGWRILDVGSGHNPHPRADVLLDRDIGPSIDRSGKRTKVDCGPPLVIADACSLPFKDKSFDHVIASHIAEHVERPDPLCRELTRVSRRCYIETPSKLCERLLGEPFHKWFVYRKGAALVFERKLRPAGVGWFYGLFCYGRERAGDPGLSVSNRHMHVFLKVLNRAVLRLWSLEPIRTQMYTCFEQEQSLDFKVKERS